VKQLFFGERPLRAEGGHVFDATPKARPVGFFFHPQNAQAFTGLPDLLAGARKMVVNVAELVRADSQLSTPTLAATAELAAGLARAMDRGQLRELERFESCGALDGALRKEATALILVVERLLREGGV
jgi:hypothetical protein